MTRIIRTSSEHAPLLRHVAGSITMEQAPLYRPGEPDVDVFNENTADHRVAPYKLRQSGRTDIYSKNFLSDNDGEPDPGEYIAPLMKKRRRASISSKILAVVCAAAAAAILVALFSSDAMQDTLVNVKASMATVFPAPSAAAQSDPSYLTARNAQKAASRPSATEDQTPGARSVTTAAVAAPAREEIRLAYQNALQGRAPAAASVAAAPVAEPPAPEPSIHHLDPDAIASLLKRADALIASGDVAAARPLCNPPLAQARGCLGRGRRFCRGAPRAAARGGCRRCARRHDARGNLRSRVSGEAGCSRLRAGPGHGAELVRASQSVRIGRSE